MRTEIGIGNLFHSIDPLNFNDTQILINSFDETQQLSDAQQ